MTVVVEIEGDDDEGFYAQQAKRASRKGIQEESVPAVPFPVWKRKWLNVLAIKLKNRS
jgi:hypothetical protein